LPRYSQASRQQPQFSQEAATSMETSRKPHWNFRFRINPGNRVSSLRFNSLLVWAIADSPKNRVSVGRTGVNQMTRCSNDWHRRIASSVVTDLTPRPQLRELALFLRPSFFSCFGHCHASQMRVDADCMLRRFPFSLLLNPIYRFLRPDSTRQPGDNGPGRGISF
jgi:hypothetical protein